MDLWIKILINILLFIVVQPQEAIVNSTAPPLVASSPQTTPATGAVDCNFESGICAWTQDTSDNFDWTRNRGSTATALTGPTGDHTSPAGAGYYVFIETSVPRQANDEARLISPQQNPGQNCLQFWYNMYGQNVNALNVYLKKGPSLGTPIFSKKGTQGQAWQQALISVNPTVNYQVVIEGVVGGGYLGDIAIDDIAMISGQCGSAQNNPLSCDFETATICSYQQDMTDNFNWTRGSGSTTTGGTGPNNDHTYGTSQGNYMFIETSAPRQPGDKARLISPAFNPGTQAQCMEFWYNMYGQTTGSLIVYFANGANLGSPVFTKQGNQGNRWIRGQVGLPTTGQQITVVFEGVRGSSYLGDIAIDDVSVQPGSCGAAPVCGFLLRSPQNGTVHYYSGSHYDSRAIYSCDSGYELQGNAERTCQETGFWNGTDPTCVQKDTRGAVTCMDCQNISDVSQCRTVRHCQTGQLCFVEQMSDIAGEVKYNAGCMFSNMCTFKSQGADHCVHCCNTDLCNVKGCGNAGFDARMNRGPLCYNCSNVGNVDECKSIALCGTDEVCMIQQLTNSGLDHPITVNCHGHQCLAVPYEGLQQSSSDLYCCPGDLCNTRPNAQTGTGGSAAIIG